jgi:acyl-CoA thioester hydrolase
VSLDFAHPLRVRYADTDAQGHVYFANYLTFADEGLSAWMRQLGWGGARCAREQLDFVFADAQVRYRGRALFEDLLQVRVGLVRVGTSSLVTRFEIARSDDVLADGQLVQVALHATTRAKRAVPAALRRDLGLG